MEQTRCIIISPVRNEGKHLSRTIASVVNQTVRPTAWIIVNDGSTDETGATADAAAAQHPWIRVIHRQDRGFRKSGAGVMEAFYEGFDTVANQPWDVLIKLDGDLEFAPTFFASIIKAFEDDPKLGIAGAEIYHDTPAGREIESASDPVFHVRGATKFYRRECWQAIGGLVRITGWDTLDEVKASMLGWHTFRVKEALALHLKPTGAADGGWKNAFKNGRGSYIVGYHPLYMLSRCAKALGTLPPFVHSLGLFSGFFTSYFTKVERVQDEAVMRYLRNQQLRRIFGLRTIWRNERY
jgi:poly-beta-1,6-N-acetyl-D-glucosamine synthase